MFTLGSKTVVASTAKANLPCHKGILVFQRFSHVSHGRSHNERGRTQITLLFGKLITETSHPSHDTPSQTQHTLQVFVQLVLMPDRLVPFMILEKLCRMIHSLVEISTIPAHDHVRSEKYGLGAKA